MSAEAWDPDHPKPALDPNAIPVTEEGTELLERVLSRLSDESLWHGRSDLRGYGDIAVNGALDASDQQVEADDPSAVRWCFIGAVRIEAKFFRRWPFIGVSKEALDRVGILLGWRPNLCDNDADGYDVVRLAIERAIAQGSWASLSSS